MKVFVYLISNWTKSTWKWKLPIRYDNTNNSTIKSPLNQSARNDEHFRKLSNN